MRAVAFISSMVAALAIESEFDFPMSLLEQGAGSGKFNEQLHEFMPALQDLHDMVSTDGPSAWFNGHELYAAHARQAESDAKGPSPASMLQMETEEGANAEAAARAQMEAEMQLQVQKMKTESMAQLEYYLKNPHEHEAEVQRVMDEANDASGDETNWVAQVAQDGFFKIAGKKMEVFTRDSEALKQTYSLMSGAPGFERATRKVEQPVEKAAMLEVTAESRAEQKKKASDMIYEAPASFRRALREWEKLGEEATNLLLSQPTGGLEEKYDAVVANLYSRVGATQTKLKNSVKKLPNSGSLMQVAQSRLTAQVAKQASSQVEAAGKVFPSLSGCVLVSKDSKTESEAAENKCLCVTDQACLFAHDGHGKRGSTLCNLLAQTGCLPTDDE